MYHHHPDFRIGTRLAVRVCHWPSDNLVANVDLNLMPAQITSNTSAGSTDVISFLNMGTVGSKPSGLLYYIFQIMGKHSATQPLRDQGTVGI